MTKSFVYWLYDSTCGLIEETGYVGVSIDCNRRLKEHLHEGRMPADSVMIILFEGTREECYDKEIELRPKPGIGWNRAMGGQGGYRNGCSQETRDKMSAIRKGVPKSKEHSDKVGAAQKGKIVSQEIRDKMSEASKGKKHSDETLAKMSAAHKGKVFSKETRDRLSKAHMGKVFSKESREKMSKSQTGTKRSQEVKDRMSEAQRRKHAERRAKLKETEKCSTPDMQAQRCVPFGARIPSLPLGV